MNKTIKCELTIRQIFVLVKATEKYKRKFRNYFLGDDHHVVKYLHDKFINNTEVGECKELEQEWKEKRIKWNEKYVPKKKEEKP